MTTQQHTAESTYNVTGSVRGNCGHTHTTLRGAVLCRKQDQRDVASLGGGAYSDREIKRTDGAVLSDREIDQAADIADEQR